MAKEQELALLRRRRAVWQALVDYVNNPASENGWPTLEKAFFGTLRELPVEFDNPLNIEEVERYTRNDKKTADEALEFWAARYRPDLRNLFTWLSLRKKNLGTDLGLSAVQFLQANSSGISWSFDYANEAFDESGDEGYPIFLWAELNRCASVMSPICRFIVDRIWEFQEGAVPLEDGIPIQMCEREGCGKFTVPERQGRKRFCSGRCRSLQFQNSRSREERAKYMRENRKTRKDLGYGTSSLKRGKR